MLCMYASDLSGTIRDDFLFSYLANERILFFPFKYVLPNRAESRDDIDLLKIYEYKRLTRNGSRFASEK